MGIITRLIDGRVHEVIPLSVRPHYFSSSPTVTAPASSKHVGTAIYGFYKTHYLLPNGDCLIMFANHNRENTQLLLITHDAEKIRHLPGKRCASIVANAISQIERYRIRSNSYPKPRSKEQLSKYQLASRAIANLEKLLEQERILDSDDWEGQEILRRDLIGILEECRDGNRLLANNPVVSEGTLGSILYEACKSAQHYQFNRLYPVCRIDQLDFTQEESRIPDKMPSYVWDSELHIGNDKEALQDTLRVICQLYGLKLGNKLDNVTANRFKRLGEFFRTLWSNGVEFIDYLFMPVKPPQPSKTTDLCAGLSLTQIKPYYVLEGLPQNSYGADGISDEKEGIQFFKNHDGRFYPLPNGDDLLTLCELSERHLYFHHRLRLQLKAFFSKLPTFFASIYRSIAHFVMHELYADFTQHIHGNHPKARDKNREKNSQKKTPLQNYLMSLQEILHNEGFLANGESLEQFIRRQLSANNYVFVREKHQPSPPTYDNPLHRSFEVTRHIASFFVDLGEKNPILGTLALAAYAYGAGAIIDPAGLAAILTKLHLKGLIIGIKPTQAMGQWMSHGTTSEAIAAAATYWEGIMVAGEPDKFFIDAVKVLKDNPAEVAIITALAIMLGYGLCKAIPPLQEEMGEFPYINYAFLGLKGGLAITDTILHPGDDWLLGTIKWLLKGGLILIKFLLGPLIESYYYGKKGFFSGVIKSGYLLIRTIKQSIAAIADLVLAILTIPFLEISSVFIHVPFRGITDFISKTLGTLGNWQALGNSVLDFSPTTLVHNYFSDWRISPGYGFSSPFDRYAENKFFNFLLNGVMLFISPPLQLIKNFLILPILDLLSLTVRTLLTILHPIVKVLTFTVGTFLIASGYLWDNSFGLIFRLAATGVTVSANWIDRLAGQLKQFILSEIQIGRLCFYDWAFKEEDRLLHKVNDDLDYLKSNPEFLEKLPHESKKDGSTNCLLDLLLGDRLEAVTKAAQADRNYYGPLFEPLSPVLKKPITATEVNYQTLT